MDIVTRQEAKKAGLTRYFTGKPCCKGHISERMVSSGACCECHSGFKKKWFATDKGKETRNKAARDWHRNNRNKSNAAKSKKRSAKLSRIPGWADLDKIREFYKRTPKGMHVDHIVPLQGRLVSGLHVHTNLQYLDPSPNISKGNKWDPWEDSKQFDNLLKGNRC